MQEEAEKAEAMMGDSVAATVRDAAERWVGFALVGREEKREQRWEGETPRLDCES